MSTRSLKPQTELNSKRRYPRKPQTPREEKALTLAVGFPCKNAVVLCADSEFTHGDSLKIQGRMIFTYHREGLSFALTGAGRWDYVAMMFQKIRNKLDSNEIDELTQTEAKNLIEETILETYETIHIELNQPAEFALVGAIRSPDEGLCLIKSFEPYSFLDYSGFECTGSGEILAKYLADIFFSPDMLTDQAVLLATYILRLTKRYIPGVGGRSDILLMTLDGEMKGQSREFVSDLESVFENFDAVLKPVLFACPDILMPEEEFEHKLMDFTAKVRQLRQQLKDGHILDSLDELPDF